MSIAAKIFEGHKILPSVLKNLNQKSRALKLRIGQKQYRVRSICNRYSYYCHVKMLVSDV
jgi:hypothetical protein